MKIFFAASLYGKPHFNDAYKTIVDTSIELGVSMQADHVLNVSSENLAQWDLHEDIQYHKKILNDIKHVDAVFAEISQPSTSVGYLIAQAVQAGKPVAAFYQGDHEPHLLKALEKINDKFQIARYTDLKSLKDEVQYMVDFVSNSQDVRFNFFISPEQASYMDWIARNQKISRSVYLRRLIEEDMLADNQFSGLD